MKNPMMLAALPALALLQACGGTSTNVNETVVVENDVTVVPVAPEGNAAAPALAGQDFANAVAASDAYEVEAGKLASEKATSQVLRDFGAMLVTAHGDSTTTLKVAASQASPAVTPDATLSAEQRENLDTLKDATGSDFDTAFRSQQLIAHRKAMALVQAYAAEGDVPGLKAWAAGMQPVIERHRAAIEGMQN